MAVSPIRSFITSDEHFTPGFRPGMEYVNGALVAHGEPTIAHSLFQHILIAHLEKYSEQLRYEVLPNVRIQIREGALYRIPDVALCPLPVPSGRVLTSVPWAVIEIVSPDDKTRDVLVRFDDYDELGVRHLLLLDPEGLTAYRSEKGSLGPAEGTSLDLPSGELPFDIGDLFRQLAERRDRGATLS